MAIISTKFLSTKSAWPTISGVFGTTVGQGHNFRAFIQPGVGHVLSPEMWEQTREWFAIHLKGKRSA